MVDFVIDDIRDKVNEGKADGVLGELYDGLFD
jgi:hypothetical protein